MSLRAFTFVIFMLSVVIGGEAFCADKQQPTEYDVKAAYVYNFAKFVEWPAGKSQNAGGAMNICVAGEDPFGPALATIEGKGVGDRKIRIRRNTSLQEVKS